MAHMNLMLYQEKFQHIQDFRAQYIAKRKVCDELGLKFGRCKYDSRVVLKENGINEPTSAELQKGCHQY